MELSFSSENEGKIREALDRYPDPEACLLPTLHLAQEQFGYLNHETMELVATRLGLPPESVISTATFYTMYNKRPVGKYHIQVCCNVSCYLTGSDQVLKALLRELAIGPGETTEDGLFTLSTVQCLASCGTGPALQVNETFHENMDEAKVEALVAALREGRE